MTEPVVETQNGLVRGTVEKSSEGFSYCAFKGIPYAEPPIGELRFKDPVAIGKWSGIKDASKYGAMCVQYDLIARVYSYSEDCLYLNVFVNSVGDKNPRKPVMVWIHGGGFYFGSGNDLFYGPDYLLRKDIVLVTVNYRLGVFGFLDLEDEIAPGNQGLKDQVMALRWVHDNIHEFGGDPGNVTIFGESAGAASVHCLTLSPLSKDLIHKAISQSGIGLNPWITPAAPKNNVHELCKLLGNELTDSKEIVEFLRTVDSKKLLEAQEKLRKASGGLFPFGPGVDDKSSNPFLPLPIEELGKNGVHIPYLLGCNSHEGIFFLLDIKKEDFFKMLDQYFDMIFKLHTERVLSRYKLTTQQFRRLYYKSESITYENYNTYVNLVSDLCFFDGIHKFVKSQVQSSSTPTYLYQFSYDPGYSLVKSLMSTPVTGTSHFDELEYLFKMRLYDTIGIPHLKKGTRDYRVMEQMTELWTNFAKYGKPTVNLSELIPVHWQPVSDGTVIRYLNIDEDLIMKTSLNIEEKYFSASKIKI